MTQTQQKTTTPKIKPTTKTSPSRQSIVIPEKGQRKPRKTGSGDIDNKVLTVIIMIVWAAASIMAGFIGDGTNYDWLLFLVPMLGVPVTAIGSYYLLALIGKRERHKKGISPTLPQCVYEHKRINGNLTPTVLVSLVKQYWNGEEILSRDFYETKTPEQTNKQTSAK